MNRLLRWQIVASLVIPCCLYAADWPNFRGPDWNGISPEKGISKDWNAKTPAVLWKILLSDDGYAGPSVADGKVFIVDHKSSNDVVRAIDIRNGTDMWTYSYMDTATVNNGFARATPAVDHGRVYTLSQLGLLNCLDLKTGAKLWARNITTELKGQLPIWQMAISPFIDGDKVIVCPGGPDAAVAALDKTTGKTIWQGGGSDKPGYATPVATTINGRRQYVVFTGLALVGVDARNGKLLWRLPWKTAYDVNAATPIVIDDTVFITTGYGHGSALVEIPANTNTPTTKWENKDLQDHFNSPLYKDGYIYGIGDPGVLVCIDIKTGKTMWKQPGFEKGGGVGVDGDIIAVDGAKGDVTLVTMTPDKYTALGTITPLGGQSWSTPIVADGKLILRNKAALVCIDLK